MVCRKHRESLIAGHDDEDGIHYAMITKSYLGEKKNPGMVTEQKADGVIIIYRMDGEIF